MTGPVAPEARPTVIDTLTESGAWEPVPGSGGHQVADSPSEDEDAEGRSETEQLVDEGVVEAERDQAAAAARAEVKEDRRQS